MKILRSKTYNNLIYRMDKVAENSIAWQNENERLLDSIDVLNTKCSNYSKTVEEFREHVKINNSEIRNLKTQLATYKDCNQGLEDSNAELTRSINAIVLEGDDIKAVDRELDTLKIQLKDTRTELDTWRMRALNSEAELEKMQEQEHRLNAQLDFLIKET